MERRLAAILFTDIVGYSRLIGLDEQGTIVRQKDHRERIIDPIIQRLGGRIVTSTGDGLLSEFPSAIAAVQCAFEVQEAVARYEMDDVEGARVLYRIGINLGDVVIDGDDIRGDGVNIAARLEGLAEPGGICVSSSVHEQLAGKLDVIFEDGGEQTLKNISRPIRIWRWSPEPADTGKATKSSADRHGRLASNAANADQLKPRRRLTHVVVVTLIACLGATGWWIVADVRSIDTNLPMEETKPLPLPDRPSIAVLPFANLSNEKAQQYFADGITDDLITDLSKVSGLFVIARNSTFAYRGSGNSVDEIASELGVRFVLQGSVRRASGTIRINAQLIDATKGETLWAERYDGKADDVFALQDAVTRQIVSVLSLQLTQDEKAGLARRDTIVPEAYDAFLRGWDRYVAQTPEDLKLAIEHFDEAIALDPDYGRAHAAIAASYWQITQRWWHGDFGFANVHRARVEAESLLLQALRWETPLAHQVATSMLSQQGRHTEALAEGAKALGLDPNDADSYVALAGAFSLAGEPDQALTLVRKAVRLNPRSPAWYHYETGLAEFGLSNMSSAARALEQAIEINPSDRWSKRMLVATYGHLGRIEDANRIVKEASASWLNTDPFTIRAVTYWYPYKKQDDVDRLAEGLRKAGLPE